MGPAAAVRELDLGAEHLLGPGALDEQLDDLDGRAGEVGGEHHAEHGAEHVARPPQRERGCDGVVEDEQDVVAAYAGRAPGRATRARRRGR